MVTRFHLPTKPENANECYALAFNNKDIDLLMSLYETNAILVSNNKEIIAPKTSVRPTAKYPKMDN